MQNPNEDTEWNDILRKKGIIPQKEKEVTEEDVISMLEETIKNRTKANKELSKLDLDELDELEDSEDEDILREYKMKRIAEIKALAQKSKYGSVLEISGQDYVNEVNNAGKNVWVILHLYKQGIPLCSLINEYFKCLASKYPTVKFIKSISQTCIPNYPDKNLPTIFIYYEGDLKHQFIGPLTLRGINLSLDELEYILGKSGAIETLIKEDPKPTLQDKLFYDLAGVM